MKEVQAALQGIGIPVMAGIWKPIDKSQNPPPQYVVYSSTTTEAFCADDCLMATRTYVYMQLWSDTDITDTANEIRKRMYAAGFGIVDQSDKGYNRPAFNWETNHYTMGWTWCYYKEIEPLHIGGG